MLQALHTPSGVCPPLLPFVRGLCHEGRAVAGSPHTPRLTLPLPCREEALRAAGFTDIFRQIKTKENSSALGLLRDVCAELDQHSEQVHLLKTPPGSVSLSFHLCANACMNEGRTRLPLLGSPPCFQCSPAFVQTPPHPHPSSPCLQRDRWDAVIRGVFAGWVLGG